MALIGIPPWLMPTDVVGAMSAGGRLGLGQAEVGERAREADQRTGLGYAQLGADEASAGARLHSQLANQALQFALHQSTQEEQRRRDKAMEELRGSAIQEAIRKDTAAEALKTKQFDESLKRQKEHEKAAVDIVKLKGLQSRRATAQKGMLAAQANDNPEAVRKYQDEIAEIDQQLKEFESPAAATAPAAAGESLVSPPGQSPGELAFPQIQMGVPTFPNKFIPMDSGGTKTSGGLRYTIEPAGE